MEPTPESAEMCGQKLVKVVEICVVEFSTKYRSWLHFWYLIYYLPNLQISLLFVYKHLIFLNHQILN